MASRKNAVVKLLNLQQLKQTTSKIGHCWSLQFRDFINLGSRRILGQKQVAVTFRGLWPRPQGRSRGMTQSLLKILVISSILEPKINCQRSQNYELRQRHPKILQNSNTNVKTCKRLGKMLVIMGMYSMHLLITEEKNVKNVVFLNYG